MTLHDSQQSATWTNTMMEPFEAMRVVFMEMKQAYPHLCCDTRCSGIQQYVFNQQPLRRSPLRLFPQLVAEGVGSVIESKMIDFALVLWLNDGEPRLEPGADDPTPDARLMTAIAEKVWQQPSDSQTVNQMTYPPLQFSPIASNLETKNLDIKSRWTFAIVCVDSCVV